MNPKLFGYTAVIAGTILLGSIGFFVRNVDANVYIITFSRVGIGLFFLTGLILLSGGWKDIKRVKTTFPLVATGILLSLATLCYTKAIITTSLANAAFLLYLAPIIAVGIAAILLKERFTFFNAILISLAFFGFLCLMEFNFSLNSEGSAGYQWGVGASLCYAFFIVLNRKIPENVPTLTRSFYQFLFAGLTILPFIDASLFDLTKSDIYWLVAVGFLQGFLATTLLISAIKYLRTVEYGTISYIEPLAASIFGYLLYAETLTVMQIMGCAIIVISGLFQVSSVRT